MRDIFKLSLLLNDVSCSVSWESFWDSVWPDCRYCKISCFILLWRASFLSVNITSVSISWTSVCWQPRLLCSKFSLNELVLRRRNASHFIKPFFRFIPMIYIPVGTVRHFTKFAIPHPLPFKHKTMSWIFSSPKGKESNLSPCIPRHIPLLVLSRGSTLGANRWHVHKPPLVRHS